MPSRSWSTTVVRRSSGRSGVGRNRAVYHSPFRQAVSSSSDPPSSCSRHLLGIGARRRRRSGWRADADVRCRSLASGRAVRPAPGWPDRRHSTVWAFLVTHIQPGRLASDVRQLAGDAHQMLHILPAAQRGTPSSGLPFSGAVSTTTPREPAGIELRSEAVRRWPDGRRAAASTSSCIPRRGVSTRRSALSPPHRRSSEVLISSHAPASA